MDYLFASSMRTHSTAQIVVLYDIACQWSINLWNHMAQYEFEIDANTRTVAFVIPKFHLSAYKESCHTCFSYNYTKHISRTDGDGVEHGWAAVNGFSGSTKEMGPGSRRDILDDTFGDYNWCKVTALRMYFTGFECCSMAAAESIPFSECSTQQGQECSRGVE